MMIWGLRASGLRWSSAPTDWLINLSRFKPAYINKSHWLADIHVMPAKRGESGYIVGEDDDDKDPAAVEAKNVDVASRQNESNDTSCAIPQDDEEDDGDDAEGGTGQSMTKAQVTMV